LAYVALQLALFFASYLYLIMNSMAGLTRCGCATNSIVLFVAFLMAAGVWTSEGRFADSPLRDASKDTSEEDSDAVFKSISPLESAIMPVSHTRLPLITPQTHY